MRTFAVHYLIRKGLGPSRVPGVVFVGLDDLPADLSEIEICDLARADADGQLRTRDDFRHYGKTWEFTAVLEA